MKKNKKTKIPSTTLELAKIALDLGLYVEMFLEQTTPYFKVKDMKNHVYEKFPLEANDLEKLRVFQSLLEFKTTREKEAKCEELFNQMINNLTKEHRQLLNL